MSARFSAIEQLTPAVLTALLAASGDGGGLRVTDVSATPIQGEAAFNAQLYRVQVTYAQEAGDRPRSLVAKLPTLDTALHANAAVFQPGRRETWFYRTGRLRTPVRVPHCYYSAPAPANGESVLLLEDLGVARAGNQLAGASPAAARLALATLARLHAAWWEDATLPPLLAAGGVEAHGDAAEDLVQGFFRRAWPRFLAQTLQLPQSVRLFGDILMENMRAAETLLDGAARTLIHGDFRLDNLFFDRLPDPQRCWLIDWEDIDFASPAVDTAWFIGGCIDLVGGAQENEYLRFYHEQLSAAGVSGYSWGECRRDYRLAMVDAVVQGILTATAERPGSDYQVQLAKVLTRRFVAACERLRLDELFSA